MEHSPPQPTLNLCLIFFWSFSSQLKHYFLRRSWLSSLKLGFSLFYFLNSTSSGLMLLLSVHHSFLYGTSTLNNCGGTIGYNTCLPQPLGQACDSQVANHSLPWDWHKVVGSKNPLFAEVGRYESGAAIIHLTPHSESDYRKRLKAYTKLRNSAIKLHS